MVTITGASPSRPPGHPVNASDHRRRHHPYASSNPGETARQPSSSSSSSVSLYLRILSPRSPPPPPVIGGRVRSRTARRKHTVYINGSVHAHTRSRALGFTRTRVCVRERVYTERTAKPNGWSRCTGQSLQQAEVSIIATARRTSRPQPSAADAAARQPRRRSTRAYPCRRTVRHCARILPDIILYANITFRGEFAILYVSACAGRIKNP